MSKKSFLLLSLFFSLFLIPSCKYTSKKKACCSKKAWSKKKDCCGGKASVAGQAVVKSVTGNKIRGEVFFEKADRKEVKVTANFKGLKPNQTFGFHVHEFGTCENKGLMAGAHLNPWEKKHGGPQAEEKHMGDLGNLKSDSKGHAVYSAVVRGRLNKFLGRSVIIHAKPDDLKSQPTGNSGDRIACGVIVAAMPPVASEPEKEKTDDKKAAVKQKTDVQKTSVQKKPVAVKKQKAPVSSGVKPVQKAKKIVQPPKTQTVQKALKQNNATKKPAQSISTKTQPAVQKASDQKPKAQNTSK